MASATAAMETRMLLRQLLRNPPTLRSLPTLTTRPRSRVLAVLWPQSSFGHARHLSTPTILRPSFWKDMIPRPFRERASSDVPRREWNPATPYIVLALLVGSQAIQILWLKQERALESRRAESRIQELREVVRRVQRGESVDVEGLLGVSQETMEQEWSELMGDIEHEELLFQTSEEKKSRKSEAPREEGSQQNEGPIKEQGGQEEGSVKVESLGKAKFY